MYRAHATLQPVAGPSSRGGTGSDASGKRHRGGRDGVTREEEEKIKTEKWEEPRCAVTAELPRSSVFH